MNDNHNGSDLDRRRFVKSMAAVGAAGLFAGCTGDDDPPVGADDDGNGTSGGGEGGTAILATPNDIETLDPRMNSLAWFSTAAHYMFDSLLMMEPDGEGTVPHLLEDHLVEEDEVTYTGKLEEGVTFHNGEEMTAEDVAYTYNWVLDPDNASPRASFIDFIDEVEATGEYEITLHLEYPFALLENILAGMYAPVVPKDAAEEMGHEEFEQAPIGTGPFQYVDHESASNLTMERFDDYFLGAPRLDGVEYRIIPEDEVAFVELSTGGVHQASVPEVLLDEAEENEDVNHKLFSAFNYRGFILNCLEEPFADLQAREAIHHLVDYDELMLGAVDQLGARNVGYMPQEVTDVWDFPTDEWESEYYPEQDRDRAVSMLEDAGVDLDSLDVDILAISGENWVGMSVVLQNEFEQIGVDASIREVSIGEWLDALDEGTFDVCTYGFGVGDDPDGMFYNFFRDLENDEGGMDEGTIGNASAGYVHQAYRGTDTEDDLQRLDELIRDGRSTLDRDERYEHYVEAADIVHSQYIGIPVYAGENATGWRTELQDYEPTEFGDQELFNHWQEAWLDE